MCAYFTHTHAHVSNDYMLLCDANHRHPFGSKCKFFPFFLSFKKFNPSCIVSLLVNALRNIGKPKPIVYVYARIIWVSNKHFPCANHIKYACVRYEFECRNCKQNRPICNYPKNTHQINCLENLAVELFKWMGRGGRSCGKGRGKEYDLIEKYSQ